MSRFALALCLWTGAAVAQPADNVQYEDEITTYTVVQGDTIRGLTKRMLGSADFWEANWRLNPTVADPDLLRIGQKLRLIESRKVIAERARIEAATNRTEKLLTQSDWSKAEIGDEIAQGNAVRTRARSTAILRFNASSSLHLGEYSQVFLTRKETTLRGIDRGSVEITEGDVDVVFAALNRAAAEIELISGNSKVIAAPDAAGEGQIRAGRSEQGDTRVMVYNGASTVSAAGESVLVETGMGTSVPVSGPPTPPEPLLPAPTLLDERLAWNYGNGLIRWKSVSASNSYVLEVCADAQCQSLALRQVDIKNTAWQLGELAAANYYYRVSAVSDSGLQGYQSAVGTLQISDATPDLDPPMIVASPVTGGFHRTDAGEWIAGPNAHLRIHATDKRSGLALLEHRYDDANFVPLTAQSVALRAGVLEIRASDALDQQSLVRYRIQ